MHSYWKILNQKTSVTHLFKSGLQINHLPKLISLIMQSSWELKNLMEGGRRFEIVCSNFIVQILFYIPKIYKPTLKSVIWEYWEF